MSMITVRVVPEYPGLVISSDGGIQGPSGMWLKQRIRNGGYPSVAVSAGGSRQRTERVHKIVCTAFHGSRPTPEHQVAHYDGNPKNNWASNLRWATPAENMRDSDRLGKIVHGEGSPLAKLSANQVREIRRELAQGVFHRILGERYGVSRDTIGCIARGKSWRRACP